MNILIVGAGQGSWIMRGQQLGAALGARVQPVATEADCRWADVIVLVKRAMQRWGEVARQSGKPVVWDALDFWQQPRDNRFEPHHAIDALRTMAAGIPALIIGATEAMADACDGLALPHHPRLDLVPTPARERVQAVGYDGSPAYLDTWRQLLERACARRGWHFHVNPPDLSQMDILVALRGGVWDGWICREWKSGVKLVNGIAAGRPMLAQPGAAQRELQPPGSVLETADDLDDALDRWTDHAARAAVVAECEARAPQFSVDVLAARYRAMLDGVVRGATCAV